MHYFETANGFKLKPVREYAEGSTDRLFATTVSNFLVSKGAAAPASGNQPVRVYSWQAAYSSIGWEGA